ncbi:hypothetical protein [Streptomyces sp. NPDC050560]|uniref:hypothetical protein n=1 Tax=Streptomyces sp. NPDC050560 TaxID=3365630 RepID=UPI003796123B
MTARADTIARHTVEQATRPAAERTTPPDPAGAAEPSAPVTEPALELLVHGVGGTTPEEMLDAPSTVRVTGDETAAVYRRECDVDAESRPRDYLDRPVPEAYVWCNLTSGNASRALWLLLLPFMVVNLAHWMRPSARSARSRTVRAHGLLVRLAGLTLTVLLVAAATEVALDLLAWQCAGTGACSDGRSWLRFLSPDASGGGWWSQPGRRLALAAAVPAALTALLWYLAHRTWSAYESQEPPTGERDRADSSSLASPGFWYGRRFVARLRAAHTAAGLLTVAAAVCAPAARHDRAPGGPAVLAALGWALEAALVAGGLAAVWVVSRRGRSERRLDRRLDGALRLLPLAAVVLLAAAVLYAGWSRPGWRSAGRLPGDAAFGAIALLQGLLVIALAVVAHLLYRRSPDPRTVLRGLGAPAVALLACALGGVMTGGVAQRVADWLDGGGTPGSIAGPPALLTWQASVIPPLLLIVAVLVAVLAVRTGRRTRRGLAAVATDYPGEPQDDARTRRIAATRARAALTDSAPAAVGVIAAVTLLFGAGALAGAWATGETPTAATDGGWAFVAGAARSSQALGSWLIGLGFILFVTWGRRAYRDASARRTIGILWDVGTFWPRAAHPFAPPCYAERAVPDLTWRMATWTAATDGRLVLSGHSQGSVLAAAATWQLAPATRRRVALLTYGCPLERLYGRWFPAHFGPAALEGLHREAVCWRNLYRATDPIGGPVRVTGPEVDRLLKDPLAYGRTPEHPLPAPILGHGDYQADPDFAVEREHLLARLRPAVPGPRPEPAGDPVPAEAGSAGTAAVESATAEPARESTAEPTAAPTGAAGPDTGQDQGSSGRSSG